MALQTDGSWHVGKEIPLALIAVIVMQTIGVVWWAATLSSQVGSLSERVSRLANTQYTAVEARSGTAIFTAVNEEQNRRILFLENRVREVEQAFKVMEKDHAKIQGSSK